MAELQNSDGNYEGPQVRLRKSHGGCRECKTRKVKCDEVRPVCSNCRRRYVGLRSCEWDVDFRRTKQKTTLRSEFYARSVTTTLDKHIAPEISVRPAYVADDPDTRALELRLMHHYTSAVGPSMPDCEADLALQMWQQRIPQLAFNLEVVLNPMLAWAALHLHAHSGHDPAMARILRRYLDRALQHHRQALLSGETELSEPTWLSAVMLTNINWLLARYNDSNCHDVYEPPVQIWKILRGIAILFLQRKEVLNGMGYGWYGQKTKPRTIPRAQLSTAAKTQLRFVEEDLRFLFIAFGVEHMADDDVSVYAEARDYIIEQYHAFYSGTSARVLRWLIGTMVSRCQPGFCHKIEKHDPLAMALLARTLVLMHAVEPAWWMNGVGEYKVLERDIPGLEKLMPDELRWTMRWPCSILDGSMKLSP